MALRGSPPVPKCSRKCLKIIHLNSATESVQLAAAEQPRPPSPVVRPAPSVRDSGRWNRRIERFLRPPEGAGVVLPSLSIAGGAGLRPGLDGRGGRRHISRHPQNHVATAASAVQAWAKPGGNYPLQRHFHLQRFDGFVQRLLRGLAFLLQVGDFVAQGLHAVFLLV